MARRISQTAKPQPTTKHQNPAKPKPDRQALNIPIVELEIPAELADQLIEQGCNDLGDLSQLLADQSFMDAILEPASQDIVRQIVQAHLHCDQEPDTTEGETSSHPDPSQVQKRSKSAQPDTGTTPTTPKAKHGLNSAPTGNGKNQPPQSTDRESISDQALPTATDLRRDFLAAIKNKASEEPDDRLMRMLTRARMDNDLEVIKIINQEIDRRFESERARQQKCQIEIHYSDLLRRGYSASQESVSRFLHRQRLTHEAGVALAKIHLAMKEGGVKMRNGKRVSTKSHVIQKLLELAYERMKR
jgi:hypothetical protein